MPRINREEYEILSGLYDIWKWVERNKKGEIWAYKDKPTKEHKFRREGILIGLKNGILQFIQWEDKKPYNIARLLGEYEEAQHVYSNKELYERFYKESRKNKVPKINQEEYEILKKLDDKWKWIARDENGEVWVYKSKPSKLEKEWDSGVLTNLNNITFLEFIQWEDEEPYNIAWLLGEYEESEEREMSFKPKLKQEIRDESISAMNLDGQELVVEVERINQIIDELDEPETLSEYLIEQKSIGTHVDTIDGEVQVTFRLDDLQNLLVPKQDEREQLEIAYKDILSRREFLFDDKRYKVVESSTLSKLENVEETTQKDEIEFVLNSVLDWVDQLDEPDVLSQEWIDENKRQWTNLQGTKDYIKVDKLKNLLVPKQEEVDRAYKDGYEKGKEHATKVIKPTIPKFVADWLDDNIERYDTVYSFIISLVEVFGDTVPEKVWTYASENPDIMARAYLDGYTVEEEPLYRARLKIITDEFIASYLRTQSSNAEDRLKALEIGSKYIHEDYRHLSEFTEDELKRLNIWDSEQWEVEEMGK